MTIIDFDAAKSRMNELDPDCVTYDIDGTPLYLYQVQYRCDDRTFSFEIWARSQDDAEDQVTAIKLSARVVGQIVAVVE